MSTRLGSSLLTLFSVVLVIAAPIACDDSTGNQAPEAPAQVQIVSGDDQEAVAGTELPEPIVVRVLDADGDPIRGQLVNFRVTSGGGSVFSGSALTNASGEARERWTLGTSTATAQRLEARAVEGETGAATVSGTFEATALPDAAHRVESAGTAPVEGTAGLALGFPLIVAVVDQHGNPVPGVTVSWAATGGGAVAAASATTDATGRASAVWTLGPQAGTQAATATVAGVPAVSFTVAARAGAPATLEIVGGGGQVGVVGTALGAPLTVRVKDAHGNVTVASSVTWSVVAGSGALASLQSATGGDGTASNTLTLGTTAGEVRVQAALASGPSVEFSIVATAGAADRIEIISGNTQEGVVSSILAEPLVVRVLDEFGNPSPGATVRWEGAGQFDPHVAPADAAGRASTVWRLGAVAGAQTATARVEGTSIPAVVFTATGTPGVAGILDIVSGDGQSGTVGQALSQPLVVLLRDGWLNPVPGASVSFTILSGAGSVNPGQPVADASGHASTSLTLGTAAGPVRIRAQLPGGMAVEFTATALPGPLTQLLALSSLDQEVRLPSRNAAGQVRAADQYGNGIGGIQVSWTVLSGSGTVSSPTVSIASGLAQTAWTLGPEPVQTMRASVGAIVSPTFTARLTDAATWSRVTLPVTAPLRDIWGTSADNIYAVGDRGTVIHFNGTSWQAIDVGTTADLTEVVGTGPDDVRLSGSGQRIHFNGAGWNPVTWPTLPSPGRLKEFRGPALARVAADDAMAIIEGVNYGGRDTVKHWNGSAWVAELVVTDTEGAYAIWMAPDGRALVGMSRVGGAGSGYHYDGTAWRTGLGGGRVTGVGYAGKSFDDVFIKMNSLGGCCSFAHSNGTTWDYNPGGSFGGEPLWFVSPDEVYYRNGTEVRRLRSGESQSSGSGTAEGVNGTVMWGTSSTNLYLIGTDGSLWRKSAP